MRDQNAPYPGLTMKYITLNPFSVVTLLAMTFSSLPLYAADSKEVQWNQICREAHGRELLVTTADGDLVKGYCVSIDANNIAVKTKDRGVVKVARKTLSKLEMERSKGHQLRTLHKGVHKGLKYGFDSLLSPMAPVGAVVLPATLAWGAVSAPFCLLGDLREKVNGTQEIKPI